MPMIKSIFIVAMPGAGNLGDDIISSILVKKYQDKYPSAKIGILTNLEKNHFGYNSLNVVLFKKPRLLKPNYYVNISLKDISRTPIQPDLTVNLRRFHACESNAIHPYTRTLQRVCNENCNCWQRYQFHIYNP